VIKANWIDGAWTPANGPLLDLVDPSTEQVIGQVLDTDAAGVAAAVAAARRAFDTGDWLRRTLDERIAVVEALMAAIAQHAEELAQLQTAQMGLPITWARALAAGAGRLAGAAIDGARTMETAYLRRDAVGASLIRREPVGVVAVALPWNGPLSAIVGKLVPALVAGCTMVLKPAPETPLEARLVAELSAAAGLPDGVFNVVTGGAATGAALVGSPGVDRVSFTGSTATGRLIGETCGRNLTRVGLELGGKSAAVLLPDADLDVAVPEVVMGNFFNSGQICVAVSRVLVPESRHDEILDAIVARAAAQVVGDPHDEATQLGPLVTARQRDRVLAYVDGARAEGTRVASGGGRPAGLDRGWYVEPTVLDGVAPGMQVAREEVFGPVMSVMTYADEAEALNLANDSDYGLHGAVFTADPERGLAFARGVTSGSVAINRSGLTPGTPYGGLKGSGMGRGQGREGVEAFLEYRSYVLPADYADRLEADGLPVR
jgi:acyl-CoA reductase-like NAD-dependent aldehyde dehydrogenase